jgi:hypothetical protein
MSSEVLGNLLAPVVEENGVKNDLSMWGHVIQGRVSHVVEILLSLVSVNGVIFSINPHWWDGSGEVSPTRVEVKLCNTVRIRVRVACSADQLSQFVST